MPKILEHNRTFDWVDDNVIARRAVVLTCVNSRLSEKDRFRSYEDYQCFIERCAKFAKKQAIMKSEHYYKHQLEGLNSKPKLDKYDTILSINYYNRLKYLEDK